MKKKIVSLALVASLLALVIVGGTLAYFTDIEDATNTFVVGNVDITLTEEHWAGGTDGGTIEKVQPGVLYAKDPVVENVGVNNAWVRVNVTFSDYAKISAADPAPATTNLTVFLQELNKSGKWTAAGTKTDDVNDTITYSYYYNEPLANGEDTGALFTGVMVPADYNNAKMAALNGNFVITVTADAIQSDTFGDVSDAFAAFDNQTGEKDADTFLAP